MLRKNMKKIILLLYIITNAICIEIANAAPLTFDCKFKIYVTKESRDFSKNDIKIVSNEIFELKILLNENEAFVIGNQGTEKLYNIPHQESGYTFLEITPNKTVQVTVIDNKLNAVHSRHTQLPDLDNKLELFPSQSYGKCEIRK